MKTKKVWLSWSTGKDSAYALHVLKKSEIFEVTGLFTTVTETYARVSMHSTREALLRKQAEQLNLPVEIVVIKAGCSNEDFEREMQTLIEKAKSQNVKVLAFGDLYLEDIRAYRERLLLGSGIEAVFPLWKRPTDELARDMISIGIKAVLTCIDPSKINRSFAGRTFDADFLNDLPAEIDPCGENGEFHTFVFESPDFRSGLSISIGEVVERDGFVFADVL
jgi:uncharacterized protein (TIGR00290 family)